tara:strand:+ start:168 stop:395 length:228 start_codon:yes stop_codon:yes gene_type:complete
MGNSDNRSIDRLDGLRLIYDLQNYDEEVSLVKVLKIKPSILEWLEKQSYIKWNETRTRLFITDDGIAELRTRKWI